MPYKNPVVLYTSSFRNAYFELQVKLTVEEISSIFLFHQGS